MEFAMFYEIPVPEAVDAGQGAAGLQGGHRAGEARVTGSDSTPCGPWSTTSSRSTRTVRIPRSSTGTSPRSPRQDPARLRRAAHAPKPYNHPVRTAESVAVLDLLSDGRVEFGTGRSATRAELEGFGIHPDETRAMWLEGLRDDPGGDDRGRVLLRRRVLVRCHKRRVLPKPIQDPHPPVWAATSSDSGHRLIGELGLGLLSFSVGTPPEELGRRISIYREGIAACDQPLGRFVNDRAASFTMVNVAHPPTKRPSSRPASSFEWYPKYGARLIGSVAHVAQARWSRTSAPTSTSGSTQDHVEDGFHSSSCRWTTCSTPTPVCVVIPITAHRDVQGLRGHGLRRGLLPLQPVRRRPRRRSCKRSSSWGST